VHLLVASILASLLVAMAPTPAVAQDPGGGGCLDELEIETPDEKATTFGAVTLAAGETFSAEIKHWTSAPTAFSWVSGFNSEIRLSPMLDDGFPGYASTSQRRSFAADGPWSTLGEMSDGTFSYTNPSSSGERTFVLEVSYWNKPSNGVVGRTTAFGFSTCVSPHSPPVSPTRDCVAAPTLVANGANVHSEPFEMERNARISMRMVDERPLRYDEAGNQHPLLRSDYLIRAWLYGRSGPDDSWHYIRRDSHRSQNNWMRGSYVGSWDISLQNRSDYTEVKVILGSWISRGYALSTPLDTSIRGSDGVWRSVCLESTGSTVKWDDAPSCAPDNTFGIGAQVTSKAGGNSSFRIAIIDPVSGNQVHTGDFYEVGYGQTSEVYLGGVPEGRWLVRMYERLADGTVRVAIASQPVFVFDASACAIVVSTDATYDWDSTTCANDGTIRARAVVTNNGDSAAEYRISVVNSSTGLQVHGSHWQSVGSGQTGMIELAGIPEGTWQLRLFERRADGTESLVAGNTPTRVFSNAACTDGPTDLQCPGPIGKPVPVVGDFTDQVSRGYDLDLAAVEAAATQFPGNDNASNHVVFQSLFDPVVIEKDMIVDEYSLTFHPGSNLDTDAKRQAFLGTLATDMDDVLGGDFAALANYTNQGTTPEVGQIIDIEINGSTLGDIAFINAPVVITHMESTCFGVRSIEYNGDEHIIHGDRRWGYVANPDGTVTFYARGLSIPDRSGPDLWILNLNTADGELAYWTEWVNGIERQVVNNGGTVVPGGRRIYQEMGPYGPGYWNQIPASLREEIKAAQIDGHQREAARVDELVTQLISIGGQIVAIVRLESERDQHIEEAEDWANVPT